jgi:CspA family cold shock protein
MRPVTAPRCATVAQRVLRQEEAIMATGTVKFFNHQRGFGFIRPADGSKDVFVHATAVETAGLGQLTEGQTLSYELERGRDGRVSAVDLKSA